MCLQGTVLKPEPQGRPQNCSFSVTSFSIYRLQVAIIVRILPRYGTFGEIRISPPLRSRSAGIHLKKGFGSDMLKVLYLTVLERHAATLGPIVWDEAADVWDEAAECRGRDASAAAAPK